MLVVLYHVYGAVSRTATDWLWAPLEWIAQHGFLGVDVFFVISGFVIALTVSKGAPTFSYFGRFILRRSIRLDPPYWAAIALELVLLHLTLRFFSDMTVTLPTVPQLVAHVFYAQNLLGFPNVVDVFWTLCYEIQFYGFFVGMVVGHALLPERLRGPILATLFCAALFGVSLWTRYWRPEWLPQGLAIDRWFQFFIGALTWRAVASPGRMAPLVAAWVALAAAVVAAAAGGLQLLAIAVSAFLVTAARYPLWGRALTIAPLTFLGAISYSLYLYHASIGWRFVSLIQRLIPGPWQPPTAVGVYLLGIIVSVGAATILWRLVELPCLKLCQRIRLPQRAPASISLESAVP